jgi:hypothetical protein
MPAIDPFAPRQITFYGTPDLWLRIQARARRERMSASCWLRILVDNQLQLVEPAGNEASRADGDRPAS